MTIIVKNYPNLSGQIYIILMTMRHLAGINLIFVGSCACAIKQHIIAKICPVWLNVGNLHIFGDRQNGEQLESLSFAFTKSG